MHRLVLETHNVVGNRTSDYECCLKEMSFDANMVIVLAALLCALVLALGLNSILRCAQRWCGGGGTLLAAETGLKKRELLQIPVVAYGSGEAKNITATECAICLGEFKDGERVRVLPPCNHGFHVDCIDTWLFSHTSCPNCRHSLLLDQPTSA